MAAETLAGVVAADRSSLRKVETVEKSAPILTPTDKLVSDLTKGEAIKALKKAETKEKTWTPTKEEWEADKKAS